MDLQIGEGSVEERLGGGPGERKLLDDAQVDKAVHEEPYLDGEERAVPPTRRPRPRVQAALNCLDEDEEARRRGVLC